MPEDVLQVRRLEIIDEKGKVKACFGLLDTLDSGSKPYLVMCDEDGDPRIHLTLETPNPKIEIVSKTGDPQIVLSSQHDGPHLSFFDASGQQRLSVDTSDGYPILNMLTPHGDVAFAVGLLPDGTAKMLGMAKDGKSDKWPPDP